MGTVGAIAGRILVVGDHDAVVAGEAARRLEEAGYEVDVMPGAAAAEGALKPGYDLVVVEVAKPSAGVPLLEHVLVDRPRRPVLVVSAASHLGLAAECLDRGAEDYLAHPFAPGELLARVRARLRGGGRPAARVRVGGITLDLVGRRADAGRGPASLADREFLLLSELVQHAGQVVSKTHLLAAVWGRRMGGALPASNVVDVYVRRLRAKLGTRSIRTVRGRGYMVEG